MFAIRAEGEGETHSAQATSEDTAMLFAAYIAERGKFETVQVWAAMELRAEWRNGVRVRVHGGAHGAG